MAGPSLLPILLLGGAALFLMKKGGGKTGGIRVLNTKADMDALQSGDEPNEAFIFIGPSTRPFDSFVAEGFEKLSASLPSMTILEIPKDSELGTLAGAQDPAAWADFANSEFGLVIYGNRDARVGSLAYVLDPSSVGVEAINNFAAKMQAMIAAMSGAVGLSVHVIAVSPGQESSEDLAAQLASLIPTTTPRSAGAPMPMSVPINILFDLASSGSSGTLIQR